MEYNLRTLSKVKAFEDLPSEAKEDDIDIDLETML